MPLVNRRTNAWDQLQRSSRSWWQPSYSSLWSWDSCSNLVYYQLLSIIVVVSIFLFTVDKIRPAWSQYLREIRHNFIATQSLGQILSSDQRTRNDLVTSDRRCAPKSITSALVVDNGEKWDRLEHIRSNIRSRVKHRVKERIWQIWN
jgi:hypothetical protein